MTSDQLMFTDETTAALVLGRNGRARLGDIRTAKAAIDALGAKYDLPLAIIGHGDFFTDRPDDDTRTALVVGVAAAVNEAWAPRPLDVEATRTTLEGVRAISPADWASLEAAGIELSTDVDADDATDDTVPDAWIVAFGPLSNGWVAFGVPDETSALPEIRGVTMEQEAQEETIWGELVCTTSYEEPPRRAPLSLADQAVVAARLGEHAASARYYLIAKYD